MNTQEKIGVLLLNLGGPERLEDVRSFLLNLFSDRDIIRLGPPFMQKIIARIIATRRAPKSRANYEKIGGGSPIRAKTDEQASALEHALAPEGDFVVRSCMRYWHPFASEALAHMQRAGVDRLIALPLYPHYSIATTGSSVADLKAQMQRMGLQIPLEVIEAWPEQAEFIDALARRVAEGIDSFAGEEVELVYSAHSLPVQFIEEGDPYVDHLEQTIAVLEAKTKVQGTLCYQSRSGPVEWLGPALPEVIERLAGEGKKNILVLPLSFVSDHVETLYEIDIEYRQLAEKLGLGFGLTRALNADPLFIAGLASLVVQRCG